MVYCTDESLDWALEEAKDSGELNTWVCCFWFPVFNSQWCTGSEPVPSA